MMNNRYYGKLIFELSRPGRIGYSLPPVEVPQHNLRNDLPAGLLRQQALQLPEVDEPTVVRHYTNMSNNNFGVDTGFYPLGSCTMKYNPKLNDEVAASPAFSTPHNPQKPYKALWRSTITYNTFCPKWQV